MENTLVLIFLICLCQPCLRAMENPEELDAARLDRLMELRENYGVDKILCRRVTSALAGVEKTYGPLFEQEGSSLAAERKLEETVLSAHYAQQTKSLKSLLFWDKPVKIRDRYKGPDPKTFFETLLRGGKKYTPLSYGEYYYNLYARMKVF